MRDFYLPTGTVCSKLHQANEAKENSISGVTSRQTARDIMADCQAETNRRQVYMADLYTAAGRQANT
jgi:hypothetical protein